MGYLQTFQTNFKARLKGNWGKYSANDYENPLDIIGFKPELAVIFEELFKQHKEEKEEIWGWLPQKYKELFK